MCKMGIYTINWRQSTDEGDSEMRLHCSREEQSDCSCEDPEDKGCVRGHFRFKAKKAEISPSSVHLGTSRAPFTH